jgi:hypothetical protein
MEKRGENGNYVRIAADPDGKNLLATYHDLYGGSGIVFDAGLERITNVNAQSKDNQRYILNIARYLDRTSLTDVRKSVLLYNTYTDTGLSDEQFDKNAPMVLAQNSYRVTLTNRIQTPKLTAKVLSDYNQLWLLSGQSTGSTFSEEEIKTILDFRDQGNGLMIVAGPDDGSQRNQTKEANQIASNFGVTFHGMVDHGSEMPVTIMGTLFSRFADKMVGYYDLMGKIRDTFEREGV